MNFKHLITAEFIKIKRSNCFTISTFGLSFIPFIVLIIIFFDGGSGLKLSSTDEWNLFIKGNMNYIGFFLIKAISVLIPVTFINIEFETNGIKQYLITPNTRFFLFTSKTITLILLFIWSLVCFYISIILNGLIIGSTSGSFYNTIININFYNLFISFYHVFLSSIGILLLSYFLMLLLRNQIKVLLISFIAISITLLGEMKYYYLIPYRQPRDTIYSDIFQHGINIAKPEVWSIIYFILFIGFSYLLFNKAWLSKK